MNTFNRVRRSILNHLRHPTYQLLSESYDRWCRDNGDKSHRLFYDLNSGSIVFDLGGYEGQWASDIFSMYTCFIHVFEPVPMFADQIRMRFSRNHKIDVHSVGLSSKDEIRQISVEANASSLFSKNANINIELVEVSAFIKAHNINLIDLMKINIEGAEYELLEHLLETGLTKNISNIQVQFHQFVPNSMTRMLLIQKELSKTHYLTYQYKFIWENWRLKVD